MFHKIHGRYPALLSIPTVRDRVQLIDAGLDKVRYYFLCPKDVQGIIVDGPGSVTLDPDFILL